MNHNCDLQRMFNERRKFHIIKRLIERASES